VCGLFFATDPAVLAKRDAIDRLLRRRGTEAPRWHEAEGGYVFAHSLLPVRGRSPFWQPYVDRERVLLFTGELWDVPAGASDTRHLLAQLASEPFACVCRKRNGIWALLYWQRRRNVVWFSTDRIGEQPLHYALESGRLAVASEIKVLVAAGFPLSAIKPVAPGATYRFGGTLSKRAAPDIVAARKLESFDSKIVRARVGAAVRALATATDLQQCSILFSGGIDSTIVAYEARKWGVTKAFTVGCRRDSPDVENATRAARDLDLELTVLLRRPKRPQLAVACGEVANRSIVEELCMHVHLAVELKRRGIRIALTGCGADELFVGYGHLLGRVDRSLLQHRFLSTYYRYDLRAFNKLYGGYAIELRHPFLHRTVVQYATRIPVDALLGPRRVLKWPLRVAYADVLGETAIRPKLIARETMGVKQLFKAERGDSPYVYRAMWKEILGSAETTARLLSRA
jgi:asparagine synthetase B (glutamine-hydrolysing)